jgi:hypothetical protein
LGEVSTDANDDEIVRDLDYRGIRQDLDGIFLLQLAN